MYFSNIEKPCHKTVNIYVFWTCVFVTFILMEVTLGPGPGSDWLALASPGCQALTEAGHHLTTGLSMSTYTI